MAKRTVRRQRSSVYGRTNNSFYIDGNTVRTVEPRFGEKKGKVRDFEPERREALLIPQISIGYYLFFFAALALTAFVCIGYVRIHSNITESKKRVASLESTLNQLRISNDEEYERIQGEVDMEEIKRIAMTELNMKYPDESQVVRIHMENDDYVRQYGKIPEK